MKEIFGSKQQRITYTASGKALVLVNEREIKEVIEGKESTSYEYDSVWVNTLCKNESSVLEALKLKLIDEIKEYDSSENVNSFTIGGIKTWLDKGTRMSLRANVSDDQTKGKTTSTFWINGRSITLPCTMAAQMLIDLEIYAKESYDITQQHIAGAKEIKTIEEYFAFGVDADYPTKLNFAS